MRFGKSAKRIKNKAHINKEQSPAELKMLLQEMKRCVPVCGWCAGGVRVVCVGVWVPQDAPAGDEAVCGWAGGGARACVFCGAVGLSCDSSMSSCDSSMSSIGGYLTVNK